MTSKWRNGCKASLLAPLACVVGIAEAQQRAPISIAAQPMERALQELARKSGADILFPPAAVAGLQARPVTGARSAAEAARIMIRGAPLGISVERSGAIVIRARSAAAPRPAARPRPAPAAPTTPARPPTIAPPEEELIVIARRREEHLLRAPVTATTIGYSELQRRGATRMDDLVQMVPQLVISEAGASPQGGIILIRGLGVGEANPLADQAVSFNIDGVQVSRANIRRVTEFDIAQVEVLKGPQALYFGKNSPAGIIVVQTRDPGPGFEARVSATHEFAGDESRLEAAVSGPLTPALGARLALFGSRLAGYFRNDYPEGSLFSPTRRRLPYNRMWGGRLTLKYDDGGPLTARLKLGRNGVRMAGGEATMQAVACPYGRSQLAPATDDCTANGRLTRPDSGPLFEAAEPLTAPEPYADQDQTLLSLDVHHRIGDALSLTLTSGYYVLRSEHSASFVLAEPAFARSITAGYQRLKTREFTQEARLSTDFAGPVNLMVGGFYQHAALDHVASTLYNGLSPMVLGPREAHVQTGNAWSGFAQIDWELRSGLELSGGVRLSHERKRIDNYNAAGVLIPTVRPARGWTDLSPEATLSWRPDERLTLYGGYRRGFLSGGFNAGTGDPATDRSYDQQVVRGVEGGIKAALRGGRLKLMAAAYRYVSNGLQVTATIPRADGTGSDQSVVNAGRARIAGAEVEAHYADGGPLRLHAAIAYNDAHYARFVAPCYAGQSIAQGCALLPRASGAFSAQDLSGRPLSRAPRWNVQGGAVLALPVAPQRSLSLSADLSVTSGYYAQSTSKPDSWQPAYALLDLGLLYSDEQTGFSLQLIARNVTDRYSFYRSLDQVFTGSGTGAASARPSDTLALVNPGRRVLLRLSRRL
ncbi:iron complex outermembrane receptor protein [Sphingobium jiangsuense]|uniref:Iron complex outermembrane receptor protein n=3 Tax=Sphingobium jiangsuense TaxID=870476 RepID=A0A7W6BGV9_9SPHN|nr:iron complex outermembrane receptor protein [Sphingobium jiangsuense]